jgi:hypothetical protein
MEIDDDVIQIIGMKALSENTVHVKKLGNQVRIFVLLADGVGFEPTVRFPARRFSRPVP